MPVELSRDIERLTPGLIELRRMLHRHLELAFEEVWTAATRAGRMRALGLAVQEGIGGTGVLAVLEGARPGKALLIRSDMDALPVDLGEPGGDIKVQTRQVLDQTCLGARRPG